MRRFSICLCLFVLTSSRLAAQDVSGSLLGRVADTDGQPLDGVAVSISGPNPPTARTTLTDERGNFRFVGLSVGSFTVRIERIGYRTVIHEEVAIRLGRVTSLATTRLEVEAVAVEPLVVRGAALAIDPTKTTLGANIEARVFEQLPTERDYKSIIQLLPQANASFLGDPVNVGGSTGLENMYYIDGVNVTDVYRGRTGTDLPYNFVQAIELKQGGYQAEHGQALGGLINVVTYSGTNEFQVNGFGYLSGSGLAADPKPIPDRLDVDAFSSYDLGVSAAGPIVRDRLWFYGAYNPSFVRQDITLPGYGVQDGTVTKHMFAGKVTWQASDATDLELSVFGDPTTIDAVDLPGATLANPDPVLRTQREGGVNASLIAQSRIGQSVVLDGLLARHQRSEESRGATERGVTEALFRDFTDPGGLVWSDGYWQDNAFNSSRTTAKVTGTFFLGAHTVKTGVQYEESVLDAEATWEAIDKDIDRDGDDIYVASSYLQDVRVRNRMPSAFLQDSWQITDRFLLNAGLRWDGQYLIGEDGSVVLPISDQWQPRLGFTFQPGEPGRQKIFGSFARFHQSMALLFTSAFQAGTGFNLKYYSVDPRQSPEAVDSVQVFLDPDSPLLPRLEDVKGEHLDEFVLGYERLLGETVRIGVKGVHRVLRANIETMFNPEEQGVGGNRGRGDLDHVPEPQRTYSALELTAQHDGPRTTALVSYVLSRSHGDYAGLFASESGGLEGGSTGPNNNQTLYWPAQTVNNKGLLPNDRTHVFKLSGAYRFDFGLTASTFFAWLSGTPLNDFGWVPGPFWTPLFLAERGTAGRTPTVWDLNFRFIYDPPIRGFAGRLVLDLLHIGNPQEIVNIDQQRFNGAAASPLASYEELVAAQTAPNARFQQPTAFQPPFTVRLGLEIGFGGQP
jgi:hypothetical protein